MNVCWVCHLYPPEGAAGAEWTAHAFLRQAAARGHTASVFLTTPGPAEYNYEGVTVRRQPPAERQDVVIGHLGNAPLWRKLSLRDGAQTYWMVHAAHQYSWSGGGPGPDRYIANSQHVARASRHGSPLVLYPVVCAERVYDEHPTATPTYVTLVNGSMEKGVDLFNELATLEPERRFLCVEGAYGRQYAQAYANVSLWPSSPSMRRAYQETRVLLVPSPSESWCMVAIEAGLNGIPIIAHPSDGLHESMADAPVYCDKRDAGAWQAALRYLDNEEAYSERSLAAWNRAYDIHDQTERQLLQVLDEIGLTA